MNGGRLNWPPVIPRFLGMKRKCPLCSSIEFKPAEPERFDGVFAVFRLHAFRWVKCWRDIIHLQRRIHMSNSPYSVLNFQFQSEHTG